MKRIIVTTTINAPTEAIRNFDAMPGWQLLVIGDRATPPGYRLDRGTYVGPEEQHRFDPALSDAIGWDCIQRRNIGIAMAYDLGAEVIALVDDDNIPLGNWGVDLLVGREAEVSVYDVEAPAFDVLATTNHPQLWHRGFPLQLLRQRDYAPPRTHRMQVHVQADLWNGDPDIDAICRMEHAPDCRFTAGTLPCTANRMAPFNSQNTFLHRDVLKDYFLFPGVGRMDDVWAAYHAQAHGWTPVFGRASVHQARNPHDLTRDMKAEFLGYEHNLDIVTRLARDPDAILRFLPERAVRAFGLYQRRFH